MGRRRKAAIPHPLPVQPQVTKHLPRATLHPFAFPLRQLSTFIPSQHQPPGPPSHQLVSTSTPQTLNLGSKFLDLPLTFHPQRSKVVSLPLQPCLVMNRRVAMTEKSGRVRIWVDGRLEPPGAFVYLLPSPLPQIQPTDRAIPSKSGPAPQHTPGHLTPSLTSLHGSVLPLASLSPHA